MMSTSSFFRKMCPVILLLMQLQFLLKTNSQLRGPKPQSAGFLPNAEVDILNLLIRRENFSNDSCLDRTSTGVIFSRIICNCNYSDDTQRICHVTGIDFSNMGLVGNIPTKLENLTYLQNLDLSENLLNDSIPASLGRLSSLLALSLTSNRLSGPLPKELGNITTLEFLYLEDNLLSGDLPPHLGNLTHLQELWLSSNPITGNLPDNFAKLTRLTKLNLDGINFSGSIPNFIGNFKELQELSLLGSNFAGQIPSIFSQLKNLVQLEVSDLAGTGRDGGFPFPTLKHMKSLEKLTLRNCSIQTPIPPYIGEFQNLIYLDLSFNKLYGAIPEFHNHLKYLYLTNNNLSGSIPPWITNSTKMNVALSNNKFTNVTFHLPISASRNVNLLACCTPSTTKFRPEWNTVFNCSKKKAKNTHLFINCGGGQMNIDGNTYEADQIHPGTSFYLSPNQNWASSSTGDYLTGDYPQKIKNGTCDKPEAALYATGHLSAISLKYYGLCLREGKYNVTLRFAEIIFTDNQDHYNIKKRYFDVFIQGVRVLKDFNIKDEAGDSKQIVKSFPATVKGHLLKIHLYWAGKGSAWNPDALYGPLISAISVTPEFDPDKEKKLYASGIVGIAVGSTLLLVFLVLSFLWKMGWLGVNHEEQKHLELFPGEFFSFHQIKAATQNFSSGQKIGEGGFGAVYKGVLPNGMIIAVKMLSSRSKQGTQEFVNEVGTISALQHPNLVRLLGCCTEDNQLLLIYEYMENNCLARAIFGSEEGRLKLNWQTRLKICLGIAKGLSFLHEESRLKIIHRDIKATNVLLDKDLNAKIADFGLAKLYEGEGTEIVTKIAGTRGYMAPEYAMRGYLTYKADVYSFGVLTLELISGRSNATFNPNEEECVYLLDLAYVLQKKGELLGLVDPILGSNFSVDEAIRMLNVAMLCTAPSPTLRPCMSEVVRILKGETNVTEAAFHPFFTDKSFRNSKASGLTDISFSEQKSGTSSMEATSNKTHSSGIREEIQETETISLGSPSCIKNKSTIPGGRYTC